MNLWELQLTESTNETPWGTYYIMADDWAEAIKQANKVCENESTKNLPLIVTGLKRSHKIIVPSVGEK